MEVRKAALFLDRLPTKPEAEFIRKWCGIAKRIEYGPDELGAAGSPYPAPAPRSTLRPDGGGLQPPHAPFGEPPATIGYPSRLTSKIDA